MDLSLLSTRDILGEIEKRYPAFIFVAMKKAKEDEFDTLTWRGKDFLGSLGLINLFKYKLESYIFQSFK